MGNRKYVLLLIRDIILMSIINLTVFFIMWKLMAEDAFNSPIRVCFTVVGGAYVLALLRIRTLRNNDIGYRAHEAFSKLSLEDLEGLQKGIRPAGLDDEIYFYVNRYK